MFTGNNKNCIVITNRQTLKTASMYRSMIQIC